MPRWIWAAILVAAWALVFFGGWPVAVGLWVHVLLVAGVLVGFWPWVRAPNVPPAPRRQTSQRSGVEKGCRDAVPAPLVIFKQSFFSPADV